MTLEEVTSIQKYITTKNTSYLTAQARAITPTPEFSEYIYCVLDGSDKESTRKLIAMQIEIMDFPKLDKSYPKSVYSLLAPVFHKSPSTISRHYHDYKGTKKHIALAQLIDTYKTHPENVPTEYHLLIQSQILLAETLTLLIKEDSHF